ncbi:CATRA system-associated protein [Streptomyces avermitilis]|uniref:CATRA system-associated protein n=1 Tax=Streptomyces avermitilis TaxID=33903 RepID=UPI0033FF3AE6
MRAELSDLRDEAREILEDVTRVLLTPADWQEVEASLTAMIKALDRGDHETFRRELYHVEDLIPLERAPRALSGATGTTEPVLERTAVLVERIGVEDTAAEQAEEQNEQ